MYNPYMNPAQRNFASAVSRLAHTNPFLPERIAAERAALGSDFSEPSAVWSRTGDLERPNVATLRARIETVAAELQPEFTARRAAVPTRDRTLYADLVLYLLYYRTWSVFDPALSQDRADADPGLRAAYKKFLAHFQYFFPTKTLAPTESPEHLFALFFQIRRAFYYIFQNIIGSSRPVAELRAAVWQSIFTCDLLAYRTSLYQRLGDIPTLITGPSGTGKELVARAIALSRYIPLDPHKGLFTDTPHDLFLPINLSALAPTLIESELFGHRKGAFTGALEDRPGYLELCPARGSVFLDEIGDLDPLIQVKLLRVLQYRTFNRIGAGDQAPRTFSGKLIAATNRDLASQMQPGNTPGAPPFRQDLYYRLCADLVSTPSLADQLRDSPDLHGELTTLVHFISQKMLGGESPAAETLTRTTVTYIERHLATHLWPGNFRELEQCVRNILIRKTYRPASPSRAPDTLQTALTDCRLTAENLLKRYARTTYARSGSYVETARELQLDRRTVKAYITHHDD